MSDMSDDMSDMSDDETSSEPKAYESRRNSPLFFFSSFFLFFSFSVFFFFFFFLTPPRIYAMLHTQSLSLSLSDDVISISGP